MILRTPSRRRFLKQQALALGTLIHPASSLPGSDALSTALVRCEGSYRDHLQGVCVDHRERLYWSFTSALVRTDRGGRVERTRAVPSHHGAPCFALGRLHVAVNLTAFNDADHPADSWIYTYDPESLELIEKVPVPMVRYGAGGIAFHDRRFVVVGGLPEGMEHNLVYEFDERRRFVRTVVLKSGYTRKGIQTAACLNRCWIFGCYGEPAVLLRADTDFQNMERFQYDCAVGIVPTQHGLLIGKSETDGPASTPCSGALTPVDWKELFRVPLPLGEGADPSLEGH